MFELLLKTYLIIATSPQFFIAISSRMLIFLKQTPWVMVVRVYGQIQLLLLVLWIKIWLSSLRRYNIIYTLSASKIIVVADSFNNYIIAEHVIKYEKIGVYKNAVLKK